LEIKEDKNQIILLPDGKVEFNSINQLIKCMLNSTRKKSGKGGLPKYKSKLRAKCGSSFFTITRNDLHHHHYSALLFKFSHIIKEKINQSVSILGKIESFGDSHVFRKAQKL
jgi:hypothetical protein